MQKLKAFEFSSPAAKSQYDWDKLLNGEIYKLEEGKDYKCSDDTIRMMAVNKGKKRGQYVKTAKVDGGVVIQMTGAASEEDIARWKEQAEVGKEAAKARAAKKKEAAASADTPKAEQPAPAPETPAPSTPQTPPVESKKPGKAK